MPDERIATEPGPSPTSEDTSDGTGDGPATGGGLLGRGALWAVLCGVAALAAGLGIAELLAAVVSPRATPILTTGDAVVDLAPAWAKDAAIAIFGTRDKLFLLTLVAAVAAALAGLAGLLESRRRGAGTAVIVVVAALPMLAAVTRPDADRLAVLPGLVAGVVAVVVLRLMLRRPAGSVAAGDRRALVLGAVLAVAGGSGALGQVLGRRLRRTAETREALALPPAGSPAPAVPAADTFDAVPGISSFRTANDRFYRIDTALTVPALSPQDWRLRIHGLVDREVEFTFDDVLGRELAEKWATLCCVSNPVGGDLIGNALWLGVPTADLLAEARPSPEADMVLSTSVDGWTAGTPLDALTDGRGSLLAVGMNGEPLPLEHGYPARLVVPGLYGYVSATKWVVDLEVTRFADAEAYWTVRGWAARGPVKIASRIDRPTGTVSADGQEVVVAGVAWAQDVGVARVEVQVADGPWQEADLAPAGTTSTWRQWRLDWLPPGPGDYEVRVRASDEAGAMQVSEGAPPRPDGATGYDLMRITVA